MMHKISALLCSALLLAGSAAGAQDLSIKDDTIRVSSSAYPLLRFMGEIRDYNTLCGDYKLVPGSTTITIRPATSRPVKVCRLLVSEGSKNSPRQHQFILLFDKETDPANIIHDYSTKDLMESRIAYLEKARGAGQESKGSDEEEDSKKSRKSRRHHKSDKHEEEDKQESARQADANPEQPANTAGGVSTQDMSNTASESAGSTDAQHGEAFSISDIPEEQLKGRVKQKINAFYRVCENLCAKIDVDGTIKYGMKLFDNNEDVIVATSSTRSNEVRPQKIRQYFIHLSQLNYKRVEMTASEIKFVSNFHKGPDGKWHASAVIIQDFKGYKDYNILAYKDQTTKTVDITIALIEEVREGKTIRKFDIFLGNISVTNVAS